MTGMTMKDEIYDDQNQNMGFLMMNYECSVYGENNVLSRVTEIKNAYEF